MNRIYFISSSLSTLRKVFAHTEGFVARRILRFLQIVAVVALVACESSPPLEPPPGGPPWPLGVGDRLRVIIFEQNQLGGEFRIGDDGAISLPLAGRVEIAGLTPIEAEKLITGRLSSHGIVKEPQVNIEVLHYRPIYVYGEVRQPGAYEFTGKLLVVNALSLAGGYTYRARKDGMTVIRDADPARNAILVTETTPVGPGDVIYVPERWF
jgi:polysaccharide export outer membrane protein